jgi:hypothetical protein
MIAGISDRILPWTLIQETINKTNISHLYSNREVIKKSKVKKITPKKYKTKSLFNFVFPCLPILN